MADKQKGTRPMGGLADAFVKAGIADADAARKARAERRREDKELGRDGRQQRDAASDAAFLARQEADAAASRELEHRRLDVASRERARHAIEAHVDRTRGGKRWYFVARDGRVPFLEVADAAIRLLSNGQAAIVESLGAFPEEHVVVADEQAVVLLESLDPHLVRFWNRGRR